MRGWGARFGVLVVGLALAAGPALASDILVDALKRPMAGNADWVVDADTWDLVMPAYPCTGNTSESNPGAIPTPPEAGITAATLETYWTGGISAWAVDLVKAGHHIESLPATGRISYGDGTNPQDLSNYDLYIVVEPQQPFTPGEKAAILAFVAAGGGLFMVGDHETSDRDCDDWDSPHVWNDLTGATSASSAGVFGIWFRVDGSETRPSADWFDDAVDANVETDPLDPIIAGPFGSGAGGLGLFGSTTLELNPADNATVKAHVWRTGAPHGLTAVTFATASYGAGRVAVIGDSSPADDDTGDPSDSLHPGWEKASGGVANREIHLNACHWLLNQAPDTTPPVIAAGPAADPKDCTASIAWTTDEPATSRVEYGPNASYGSEVASASLTRNHALAIAGLTPSSEVHYRVSSTDAAGNGPTASDDATFTTTTPAPPAILSGPAAASITSTGALITWTTDEPSSSVVDYGADATYGSTASGASGVALHSVAISGLSPQAEYHFRASSIDGCGNGPAQSGDSTFTTAAPSIDVGGFTLRQFNSSQSYVIPAGTLIPEGGYLVVGRSATRAEFLATYPAMPAATVYLDSNADGSCSSAGCFPQINGGESFELRNAADVQVDGVTVTMSSTHSSYRRNNPGDPAGSAGSWTVAGEAGATPGSGAGVRSGSGVRINEMSDAPDFPKEFVELFYDAGSSGPDSTAPAAVTDLVATPLSPTTIRLSWTAAGDDGATGTASSYDVRMLSRRILNEADFAAATPLTGEPAPASAGAPQQFLASGLAADTACYFALKVADEVPNVSGLSNHASGVTSPAGAGSSVPHLVISQLRIAGSSDDVIEIYNPTASPISLASHSIQYLAANGNFGFRVNLPAADSVPPQGWYLVAGNGYAGLPARDASLGTSNLSATAGHALLVSKATNVTGCADTAIVDKLGYGATATCPEGGAGNHAASPGASLSISRLPGGESGAGQDTDVNASDFAAPASPVFHNQLSTPASPGGGLGNVKNTLYLSKVPGGARLDWANAAGATQYRVYRGTTPDFMASAPVPWATPGTNTQTDAELPSPVHFYVIRASDGSSESAD